MNNKLINVMARAVEWDLGISGTGSEQVAVRFKVNEDDNPAFAGRSYTWYGYFSDKALDRTLESLRIMGWKSDSIAELDGLGDNDVSLALGEEFNEQTGETFLRVKFVNKPQGLALKNRMDEAAKRALAARIKGAAVASRQKLGAPAAPAPQRQGAPAARPPQRNGRAAPPPVVDSWPTDEDSIPF